MVNVPVLFGAPANRMRRAARIPWHGNCLCDWSYTLFGLVRPYPNRTDTIDVGFEKNLLLARIDTCDPCER